MADLEHSGSWIPDTACKTYIFISGNLLSCEKWKQLKNLLHSCQIIALSKGTIFAKNADF